MQNEVNFLKPFKLSYFPQKLKAVDIQQRENSSLQKQKKGKKAKMSCMAVVYF